MSQPVPENRPWHSHFRDVPRVVVRELVASARAAVAPIARFRPLPKGVSQGRPPVILVHGYMGHPDMLRALERALRKEGWHQVHRVGYPSMQFGLEQIAQRIDQTIAPAAVNGPVDLVGHSLGAVACRAWLKAFGGHRYVRRFVSLGGAHSGTHLYPFTPPRLWPVLNPDGPWVHRLSQGEEPVPTTVIRSRYDHQVLPPVPGHLQGVTEVVLDNVGHNGLLWSRAAHSAVIEALR